MDSLNSVWQSILAEISKNITSTAYNTWFADCSPVELGETNMVIQTTSDFKRSVITSRFGEVIRAALREIFSCDMDLVVLTTEELEMQKQRHHMTEIPPEMDGYTFDRFVVGPSNKFAHAAAIAVAENPGKTYNPLFIYGNSGLGKTHLLLAIGQRIHDHNPESRIVYVSGDDFTNEMVHSIRNGMMDEFRNKYRLVDLLLVDDIQFIAGKASTQEEFFHTFDALHKAQKQIVLTSDRPPKDMEVLNDRLRTRFEWGLIADIQAPDIETRMAIIQRKAQTLGLELPLDVVEHISEKIKTNVRQLEGVVKKINALVNLEGSAINIAMVESAMRDFVSDSRPVGVIVDKIIEETGRTFGVAAEDISSMKRDAKTAKARQVAVYAVREVTGLTQEEIGVFFGGRDRTTILYSYDKVAEAVARDPAMRKTVENIMKNVREGKATIQ